MTRISLVIFFICSIYLAKAQQGFLLVQKKDKTIGTFTTGAYMEFATTYNRTYTGILAHIRKDSFSILQYRIIRKGSPLGFILFDTIYNGYQFFHKNEIATIKRKKPKGTGFKIIGGIGKLGGIAMAILNVANGRRFGYTTTKDYLLSIFSNGILPFVAGTFLKKGYKEHYIINKKHSIALMNY